MSTTHRPTFETNGNSFWSIDTDGNYLFDGEPSIPRGDVLKKFETHARIGWHADCAICRENTKREREQAAKKTQDMLARMHKSIPDYLLPPMYRKDLFARS